MLKYIVVGLVLIYSVQVNIYLIFFHFSIYFIDTFVRVLCFKHTRRQSLVLM